MIRRGHKVVEGGYTWITDPKIKGSGPLELSAGQLEQLLDNTTAETLFIVADMENQWLKRSIDVIGSKARVGLQLINLPGHHHLHMQEQSGEVAELINNFTGFSRKQVAS